MSGSDGRQCGTFRDLLARYGGNEAIQKLVAARLTADGHEPPRRRRLLQSMAQAGQKNSARRVGRAGGDACSVGGRGRIAGGGRRGARDAGRGGSSRRFAHALIAAAANEKLNVGVRLDALAAVPGGLGDVQSTLFDFVRKNLASRGQVSVRLAAADVLSKRSSTMRSFCGSGRFGPRGGPARNRAAGGPVREKQKR